MSSINNSVKNSLQNKVQNRNQPPKNEEIILDRKIPFKVFYFSHGFLWLLIFGWNIGLFVSWLQSVSWHIKLTGQRIILIKGILSQKEEAVDLYRVRDSGFKQSLCQRIFGIGMIAIYSDDATSPLLKFPIFEPKKYIEIIRVHIQEQRKEMSTLQVD